MKKYFLLFALVSAFVVGSAQDSTNIKKKKDWSKVNISNRPKDHLIFQLGGLSWTQKPDSITTKGLSRSFNFYFSFDFPFKTDTRFSVGLGVGVGTDHMFFDKASGRDLNITNTNGISYKKHAGADTAIRYKSVKLQTAYLEAPVELRFMSKPETPNKSLKLVLGVKIGTLISAVDKTKFERDAAGNAQYTRKEKDKKNFNNLRIAPTARIGYGNLAIFAQYQLNDFIKEGQGPNQIKPLTIGITLTGL
jgi:hypothetical protein